MTLDELLRLVWRAAVTHAVGIVIAVVLFVALVLVVWQVRRTTLGETVDIVIDGRWFERGFYGAIALVLLAFAVLAVINNWPRH